MYVNTKTKYKAGSLVGSGPTKLLSCSSYYLLAMHAPAIEYI